MLLTKSTAPVSSPWLRDKSSDMGFIVGLAALGLLAGAIVINNPRLFVAVFFLDVWLLGYHHVISTYSRLFATRASIAENRELITIVPIVVFGLVALVVWQVGAIAIMTTYLYWQWFHYTRQSWGVARVYQSKSAHSLPETDNVFKACFYLLPLWGILHRSAQGSDRFLGAGVWTLPVPTVVANMVGGVAIASILLFVASRFQAWRRNELPGVHTLYMASHFVMFGAGYLAVSNIDYGWLTINVWHNAQYIAFVWYFNNRNAAKDSSPGLVHRLSTNSRIMSYISLSLLATAAFYFLVGATLGLIIPAVILFQTINFHHYVVDGQIWKVRSKTMRSTLGLRS